MLEILLSEDQIRVAAARARAGLARRDVRRFDHVTLMRGAAALAVATNALAVSCEANQAPAPSALGNPCQVVAVTLSCHAKPVGLAHLSMLKI